MRHKLLISVAVIGGFFVIGGEWYLVARPAQNRLTPSPTPAVAKPAGTITATVGAPSTTPSLITVNTPTTVTVTVQINPTPIANGVNLLRLGPTGTQPKILGVMHDDGTNDGVYALQVNFNEPNSGQIQMQISVAFPGLLKRVTSPWFTITVWGIITDLTNHFSVDIPPGWTLNSYPDTYTLSSTSTPPVQEGDPGNEIQVNILPLNAFTNLEAWLQDYFSGEIDFSSEVITYYTNKYGLQFAILNKLPGLSSDNTHAFTIIGNNVLEISVTPASSYGAMFSTMLSTLRGD